MKRPKSYHHGNLRAALLKSALRLISEVGPTAFTLREVAQAKISGVIPSGRG